MRDVGCVARVVAKGSDHTRGHGKYLANPEVKVQKGHKTDDKDGWHDPAQFYSIAGAAGVTRSDTVPEELLGTGTAEKNRVQKVLAVDVRVCHEISGTV